MYKPTKWLDHVTDEATGEIIQEGTNQSAGNFNKMERGITDGAVAQAIMMIAQGQVNLSGYAPIINPAFQGDVKVSAGSTPAGALSAGRVAGSEIGWNSIAFGQYLKATANYAAALGGQTEASGPYSLATGYGSDATAKNASAHGNSSVASGEAAFAQGNKTTASGEAAHAEGDGSTASGEAAHAEGSECVASGPYSHSEGGQTKAISNCSHSEGGYTEALEVCSHSEGYGTKAGNWASHAQGKYNKAMSAGGMVNNTTGDAMVIGNGTSETALANAFRVTFAGAVYGRASYNSSGADYAEFFEWLDGNPDSEDRVGFFVTLDGRKIRTAEPGEYILGIISGNPCIIGNADEDWLGRWMHDEFGRYIKEDAPKVTEEWVKNEDGTMEHKIAEVEGETDGWRYKANPDYDPAQPYIERKDRAEWDAVGMMGVLAVRDDGTCEVNGYAKVAPGGTATAAEKFIHGETYRVIERTAPNVVNIIIKC